MSTTNEVKKNFRVALDIAKSISNREFSVVEGDTGNILTITLTDNGTPVDLTDCRVLVLFSKSNGETMSQDSGEADGGITIGGEDNNEISVRLFPSSVAPGMVESEIQVYSGEELTTLITTAQFNFKCRRGILNEDTIAATEEYPIIISLISRVQEIETAEAARARAERLRVNRENGRENNESYRFEAEVQRHDAEEARAAAELERESRFAEMYGYWVGITGGSSNG